MSAVAETGPAVAVMHSRVGVVAHLAPTGALLEQPALDALSQAFEECLGAGETHVVVDLGNVPLLNSLALEIVHNGYNDLLRCGGQLRLANAQSTVAEVLRIVRLAHLLGTPGADPVQAQAMPAASGKLKLGDLLVAQGLLTQEQVEQGIALQRESGGRLGQILVEQGRVSEGALLAALGAQLGIPHVQLRPGLYDPAVINALGKDTTTRLMLMPLFRLRDTVYLATPDPQAIAGFDEVEERLRCRVEPVLVRRDDILEAVGDSALQEDYIPELVADVDDDFEVVDGELPDDYAAIDELAAGSPVVNLVNSLIQRAVHDGASDIHIEPGRNRSRVRFRIDGVLYEVMAPRSALHPALISRLKVMANLDIAERRLPQDGRIQVHTQGRVVDLRFSSLPGLYGEKVVLRVLDKNQAILDVNRLGMTAANLASFTDLLNRSHGLILVTGPTGSGKTTSLYAGINYLNSIEKNIVTIEDPVEYQLDVVNQNEVKVAIGLSFAKILKHTLRQDPDIVMVGEIRERETAEIAVQAALTGHLVLSTLHTNDSVGAVTRMLDMGVEPYLLSSAMIGVIAQRLVRTVCPACRATYVASPELVERFAWHDAGQVTLARGRGCPECYDSGYKGRVGIHEVVPLTSAMQQLILSNPSRNDLVDYLVANEIRTLLDDGVARAREGLTTIEEVSRVITA